MHLSRVLQSRVLCLLLALAGWTIPASAQGTLTLTLPASLTEGGSGGGSVSAGSPVAAALTVSLSSTASTRLSLPVSVTIPAGGTSVSFTASAVQNTAAEESLSVTATASADGYTSGTRNIQVIENDPHHFGWSAMTQQTAGWLFPVTVTALSPSGQTVTGFTGFVSLSAADAAGPVTLSPNLSGLFSAGVWFSGLTITKATTNVVLTAKTGTVTGTSNAFNVIAGFVHHWSFSSFNAAQTALTPFDVTLTALDAWNNIATTMSGSPGFFLAGPYVQAAPQTNVVIAPLQSRDMKARTQVLYTAAEIGPARRLYALGLNIGTPPSTTHENWTIRLKHSPLTAFPSNDWDNTGWTTVFTDMVGFDLSGWMTFQFTAPFDYDGVQSLLVDFSFNKSTVTGSDGNCKGGPVGANRLLAASTSSATALSPLQWTGAGSATVPAGTLYTAVPQVRFHSQAPPFSPAFPSTSFVAGVWTGPVTMLGTGAGLSLIHFRGTGYGMGSNLFTVSPASGPALAVSSLTPGEDFYDVGPRGLPPAGAKSWTLSNPGLAPLDWTAYGSHLWITVSPAAGTLPPGGSTTVTASFNADAALLPAGLYHNTVFFNNAGNGVGNTTRQATLTLEFAPLLRVLPADAFDCVLPPNGAVSPAERQWTVTNIGELPMTWAGTSSVPWISLTPASGTLARDASVTVTGSVRADVITGLAGGLYPGTVSFINVTNGGGNTTVPHTLSLLPPKHLLNAEPPFTGGTSNLLSWPAAAGSEVVEVQADSIPAFTAPLSSGWVSGNEHPFTGLADTTLYHFRARRGSRTEWQMWTQHNSVSLASGTLTNTAADFTGVGLYRPGAIINPGFELGTASPVNTTGTIDGWTRQISGTRLQAVLSPANVNSAPLPTEGAKAVRLYSTDHFGQPFAAGNYAAVRQSITFAGAGTLTFDARTSSPSGLWSSAFSAQVRLDNTVVWSATTAGQRPNQILDVSSYSGTHVLEFRIEILTAGNHLAHDAWFDHVRLSPSASYGYVPSGTLVSPAVSLPAGGAWGQLLLDTETPTGTSLQVDILNPSMQVLASGVTHGTDLGALPALPGQSSLHLRGAFATSSIYLTPRLRMWSLTTRNPVPSSPLPGPWSDTVSSTQDAVGPVCAVTSSAGSGTSLFVITGTAADLSGIASLTINGQNIVTTDAFAHWSLPVTLAPAANAFTLVAADHAVPPNVTALPFIVTWLSDTDGDGLPDFWESEHGLNPADASGSNGTDGDEDADGLTNLVELALDLDPRQPDAGAAPRLEFAVNPADGLTYAVMIWRRRPVAGFTFQPLSSTGLDSWSTDGFEELSAVPLSAGAGETVTTRLLPAISAGPRRLVRLRVTAAIP